MSNRLHELALLIACDPEASGEEQRQAEQVLTRPPDIDDLSDPELELLSYLTSRLTGQTPVAETEPYRARDLADAMEMFAFEKREIADELAKGRVVPKAQHFGCPRCYDWDYDDDNEEEETTENKNTEG